MRGGRAQGLGCIEVARVGGLTLSGLLATVSHFSRGSLAKVCQVSDGFLAGFWQKKHSSIKIWDGHAQAGSAARFGHPFGQFGRLVTFGPIWSCLGLFGHALGLSTRCPPRAEVALAPETGQCDRRAP